MDQIQNKEFMDNIYYALGFGLIANLSVVATVIVNAMKLSYKAGTIDETLKNINRNIDELKDDVDAAHTAIRKIKDQ